MRIEYPGAFYHVMARGNEQRAIFRDRADREKFLFLLQTAAQRYQASFSLFCLMDNHYHLLLETPRGNLSVILHSINASYTGYFNRTHGRVGHLLQGRFKAILVEKDAYGVELSRYIHLNPVRAGIVTKPEKYPWSSYRSYIGLEEEPAFLQTDTVLSYLGKSKEVARKQYRQFIEEGLKREIRNPWDKIVASTVLGSADFIGWLQKRVIKGREVTRDLPALRSLVPGPSVETIRTAVKKEIANSKLARRVSLYLAHRYSGLRLKEIGRLFGNLSESGVSCNTGRMEKEMENNKKFKLMIEKVATHIMQNE